MRQKKIQFLSIKAMSISRSTEYVENLLIDAKGLEKNVKSLLKCVTECYKVFNCPEKVIKGLII